MDDKIYIDEDEFRHYFDGYYVNKVGTVFSSKSNRIIKSLIRNVKGKEYYYVDIRNHPKYNQHVPISRMVYECWCGKLSDNDVVRHYDDNSLNNDYKNLYKGTQKDNIADCIRNNHRVGGAKCLIVYDKENNTTKIFAPSTDFIEYSGHSAENKCLTRMFTRKWFKERFDVIRFFRPKDLEEYNYYKQLSGEC